MTTTEVVVWDGRCLVNLETGELLPATVANAAACIEAAREMKRRIDAVVYDATAFLHGESQRQGTKTLHMDGRTVTLTGGASVDYDTAELMLRLAAAGCPDERIAEAVPMEITYKANRAVLRQLAAANPEYAEAIRGSEIQVEKPYRASVKS